MLFAFSLVRRFYRNFASVLPGLAPLAMVLAGVATAQTPRRPQILGIAHISLFAHDSGKSEAFYKDQLGFAEPFSFKHPDGSLATALFKINDRQYIQVSPERTAGSDRLEDVALETDDVEGLRRYLAGRATGVPAHVQKDRMGDLSFDVTDPDGHVVQMVQYANGGFATRNLGKDMPAGRVSKHMTHVGLITPVLDAEYRFYTEVLGFRETWRGSSDGRVLSWINLAVPDGTDYVELMLGKQDADPRHWGSAHHLCLQVADIPLATQQLKVNPAFASYDRKVEPRLGTNRKRQLNLFDPDGTRVELMEAGTIDGRPTPPSSAPAPK